MTITYERGETCSDCGQVAVIPAGVAIPPGLMSRFLCLRCQPQGTWADRGPEHDAHRAMCCRVVKWWATSELRFGEPMTASNGAVWLSGDTYQSLADQIERHLRGEQPFTMRPVSQPEPMFKLYDEGFAR